MKKKINIARLEFGPELCGMEAEWDALLERSSRPTIFSSFDFFHTSCRHFRTDVEIFILLFRDAETDRLLAIFPMSMDQDKAYGIELRVVSHATTPWDTDVDKPYPIILEGHEEVCWNRFRDYFRREFKQWDVIEYDEFMPESHLNRNLKSLFPFPFYWTKTTPGPDSPIVRLNGDWEEFWMGHRKLRKNSRRLENKMGENLSYKVTDAPEDVEECLNHYIATELLGAKAGKFVSHPRSREFYHELFPRMAAQNRLFFGMMYDQGKVMSVEIAYAFKDRIFFAHGTYDPAYAHLSPGTVNSSRLIRFFHGKGFVEGDFLAGFSGYNNPWASRIEKTVDILIRRMGWKNWHLALRHIMKKTKKRLFGKQPEPLPDAGPQE